MPRDDQDYLRQMLDAAYITLSFTEGRARDDLDSDLMLFFAVVKAIELIGEAASHVNTEVRGRHRTIEWAKIIGMRNRLAHVFRDINKDIVWNVIQLDIPRLIPRLEHALSEET